MSIPKSLSKSVCSNIAFSYKGHEIAIDENRFVDITQMWRATGSPSSKKPSEWARHAATLDFVQSLAGSLKVGVAHLWKSRTGKGVASTKAHWQIALAYAKYLSPEFHRFVNEAFREWAEEKANPDLKVERAVETYQRRGWDDQRIAARIDGVTQRKLFTDSLKVHGVQGIGYAICTDAINKEVLGASAKEIKLARGVNANALTRDHLDTYELAGIRFAEAMAQKRIESGCSHGNSQCCDICRQSGQAVHQAIASMGLTS